MDVKSAFLNRPLQEEVYVEQPPGFQDSKFPNHVYKLHKELYGLRQAPRAWYECLKDFLLKNGLAKPILLSSYKEMEKIYSFVKFMLMISFLDLLMINFVKN
jgi:hypothetical protein